MWWKIILFIGVIVWLIDYNSRMKARRKGAEEWLKKNSKQEELELETHTYPDEVKRNFIKGCKQNPSLTNVDFDNLFNLLQEQYTLKEYIEIENKINNGQTPQEFIDFMQYAISESEKQ